jgi:hypothetical protein
MHVENSHSRSQERATAESKRGHEADVVRVRNLGLFAGALVALAILVEVILGLVMHGFRREESSLRKLAPPRFPADSGAFPAPRLQPDPAAEFARFKEEELRRLHSYGWIDRKAGIAHIPIERAMDILARSNLPSDRAPAAAANPATSEPPAAAKPGDRPEAKKDRQP